MKRYDCKSCEINAIYKISILWVLLYGGTLIFDKVVRLTENKKLLLYMTGQYY